MELFGASLHESHPRRRRHTTSGLGSFLRTAMGGAFLSFFEDSFNRRPTLEENQQSIQTHFQTINTLVESVDQHIRLKLQAHESEVFAIVQEEVQQMRLETERTVRELNQKIKEKSVDSEMWLLNNQLDYFRSMTFRLFAENRELLLRLKLLVKTARDGQLERESLDATMQKLRRKYLRERARSKQKAKEGPAKEQPQGLKEGKEGKEGQAPKGGSLSSRRYEGDLSVRQCKVFEQASESRGLEGRPDQSAINIRLTINPKQAPRPSAFQTPDATLQQLSIPSLTLKEGSYNNSYVNSLPPAKLTKVESYDCDSESHMNNSLSSQVYSSSLLPRAQEAMQERGGKGVSDRGTQTEEMFRLPVKIIEGLAKMSRQDKKGSFLARSQRCNTEQHFETRAQAEGGGRRPGGREESLRGVKDTVRQTFRVAVHPVQKPSRSIAYISNVLRRSKLGQVSTVRHNPRESP